MEIPFTTYSVPKIGTVRRWDCTPADILETLDSVGYPGKSRMGFVGNSKEELRARLTMGAPQSETSRAEALIESFAGDYNLPARIKWERKSALFGTTLRTGAYTAGAPNCFKRRIRVQSEHAPVRLFVGLNGLGCIKASELAERGIACIAFALYLQSIRPVELYGYIANPSDYTRPVTSALVTIKIGLSPIDVSEACTVFGSPGIFRGWYGLGAPYRILAQTAEEFGPVFEREEHIRVLQPEETDIVLGRAYDPEECTPDYVAKTLCAKYAIQPEDSTIE